MGLAGLRQLLFWILAALTLGACSSSQAPAPPPTSSANSAELKGKDYDDDDDDFDDDEDDEDFDDDDEGDDEGSDGDRDDCGADIADQETQDAVLECIEDGRFFDRFAGDNGKCTRRKAANVNCNEDAILALLSSKQKKQFEDALEGSYADFEIDQIADCPPNTSSSVCKENGDGESQTGTKIFFVKEEDTELLGKAMLLPFRPGQTDDESDDEDADEDGE